MRISDWSSDVCSSDLNLNILTLNSRSAGEAGMGMSLPVRMAIGHAHFEAVHPFSDGNGRILWPLQLAAAGGPEAVGLWRHRRLSLRGDRRRCGGRGGRQGDRKSVV